MEAKMEEFRKMQDHVRQLSAEKSRLTARMNEYKVLGNEKDKKR